MGNQRVIAGRYRLEGQLGVGGMGTVWRAHDEVLGRPVAVKEVTFPPGVSEAERDVLRERTRREGRAAARLDHPSAVTVYDVAEQDGAPYLVMELVEARTLSETVTQDGPLTPQRTAEVGLAVLGALEAAHARGIVHRDVKPANVLLRPDGRVVLTDFGIATFVGDSSLTSTGLVLGSPSYIAPERAQGAPPGPPSDLWSLGATLFTAVEGRPPFDKGEPLITLTAVISGEHEPFRYAGALETVLDGLLERDPARRYDAARARSGLRAVLAGASPAARVAAPVTTAAAATAASVSVPAVQAADRTAALAVPTQGRRRGPVLAGLLLAATAAGGALLLLPGSSSRTTAGPPAPSAAPAGVGASRGPTPTGAASPLARSPRAAATPAAAPAVTATTPGGPAAVPAGWVSHRSGSGQVALPASYVAGTYGGFPEYRDAATGRTLRLSSTAPGGGGSDALQDRRDQAASFARRHAGYREISIARVGFRGLDAADWEFTWSDAGARLHTLSRVFVLDGRGYSLYFQTRGSDDWAAARSELERISTTFVA